MARCVKGADVELHDIVLIDGKKIPRNDSEAVYLALNKPIGIVCTAAEHVAETLFSLLTIHRAFLPSGGWIKPSEG